MDEVSEIHLPARWLVSPFIFVAVLADHSALFNVY